MELKALFQVIKNNKKIFFYVWLIFILIAFLYLFFEPKKYKIILPITVTQNGSDDIPAFKYDQYYLISANEKFAEYLSALVETENFANNLNLKDKKNEINIKAINSAPGFVDLQIKTNNRNFNLIVEEIKKNINKKIISLRPDEKTNAWFDVDYEKYIVSPIKINKFLLFSATIIFGFFISLGSALFRHYWKQ